MSASASPFVTFGILRRSVSTPEHPVEAHQLSYVLAKLKIKPLGKAGNAHVYPAESIEQIKGELARIAERRASSTAACALA